MKTPEEIILPEDPRAATPHTLTGWLSRDGQFFVEERLARWSGSTHTPCEKCGAPCSKGWLRCSSCRAEEDALKFAAMPRADWDGKQMVYSQTKDKYFSSPADAIDELEGDETEESLRLVLCDPIHARTFDADDYVDYLPEDGDLPDEVQTAMDAFNEAVKDVICCWEPGKFALNTCIAP